MPGNVHEPTAIDVASDVTVDLIFSPPTNVAPVSLPVATKIYQKSINLADFAPEFRSVSFASTLGAIAKGVLVCSNFLVKSMNFY